MFCEAIPGERLAGLTLSDDPHGIGVTCHDWISAQKTEMEKAMCLIFLAPYTPKKKK